MTSRPEVATTTGQGIPVDSPQVPGSYTLVWNDEFDGTGLPDSSKWFFETWGDGEVQQYTVNDRDNANLADGKLNLVARKEVVPGTLWDPESRQYLNHNYAYSSARLSTDPHPRTDGFVEVRAKIPVIGGNFHVLKDHGNPDLIQHFALADLFTAFHKYQLLWTPAKLTILVDGQVVNSYPNDPTLTGKASVDQWPFDSPENLILNLAIQGKGIPVADEHFPVTFQIDYVRWYQKP